MSADLNPHRPNPVRRVNLRTIARASEPYSLRAADGEIGQVEGYYFDRLTWAVRYLRVNTRHELKRDSTLISPVAIGEVCQRDLTMAVELTRQQIENSPRLEVDEPLSRRFEVRYYRYYDWPPYWMVESELRYRSRDNTAGSRRIGAGRGHGYADASPLLDAQKLNGYRVAASDTSIGRVADCLIDTQYWTIPYLEVERPGVGSSRRILVSSHWIDRLAQAERRLALELTQDSILAHPLNVSPCPAKLRH